MSRAPGARAASGCLVLMVLPFAAVGLGAAALGALQVAAWAEARAWAEAPARIEALAIDPDYPTRTVAPSVGSGEPPIRVRYRYEAGGTARVGERVWLAGYRDTVGSFWRDAYRELDGHRRAGTATVCFVDPEDPERAVLYRELRWQLLAFFALFCLAFGGPAAWVLVTLPIARRRLAADRQYEALHPDEPWLWRRQWRGASIVASGREALLQTLGLALLWNLLAWSLILFTHEQIFDPDRRVALVALVFPLVGIGLAVWAARAWMRWRRFGDSELELATLPVAAGGRLEGTILTAWRLPPGVSPRLVLDCRAAGSHSQEHILWQRRREVPPHELVDDGARTAIPVAFELPPEARETDGHALTWKLTVAAPVPGVDYLASFEIPVFGRAAAAAPRAAAAATAPAADPLSLGELTAHGITATPLAAGGHRYTLARARQKPAAALLSAFFLVWVGFLWLIWKLGAPAWLLVPFAGAALVLFAGVLDLWLTRRELTADASGLAFRTGFLALGRRQHLAADDVALAVDRGMRSGNRLYYRLLVATAGRRYALADKLDSAALAGRLAAAIERDLGR